VCVTSNPDDVRHATRLILPGVGAFPAGMKGLHERGLIEPIKQAAREGKPLIGICLGMQLLFESSAEMAETAGLGLLPGRVTKIKMQEAANKMQDIGGRKQDVAHAARSTQRVLKIPHMGWNQLDLVADHPMVRNLASGSYAYFVHSYAVYPNQREIVLAATDYGGPFASIVGHGNVCGLQFHPEKSQTVGLQLLQNFLEM
jgi:glutamine amidotransferase